MSLGYRAIRIMVLAGFLVAAGIGASEPPAKTPAPVLPVADIMPATAELAPVAPSAAVELLVPKSAQLAVVGVVGDCAKYPA